MSSRPLVSICMPSYNHARFLPAALDSILAQTYHPIELVIVDDGSKDESLSIAEAYAAKHPHLIRVFTHPGHVNRGISATLNLAFEKVSGQYWIGFGSDDVMHPELVASQVNYLDQHPNVGGVYCAAEIIDEEGRLIPGRRLGRDMTRLPDPLGGVIRENGIFAPALTMRREKMLITGSFDETLAFSDWEYWVRFLAHSHLGYNDLPLVKYRIHSSNMSIGIDPSLYLAHEIAVLKSLASKAPNLAGSLAEPRYRALIHLQLALKLETAGERARAKSSLQDAREVDPAFVPDPGDLTDLMKMNRSHQIVKIGYFGLEEVARGRVRRGVFLIAKTSFMSPRPREKLKWLCCAVLAPFVHTKQLGRLPSTPITFKQVWEILRHGRIPSACRRRYGDRR